MVKILDDFLSELEINMINQIEDMREKALFNEKLTISAAYNKEFAIGYAEVTRELLSKYPSMDISSFINRSKFGNELIRLINEELADILDD
jgi:hypothetical protein